MLETYTEHETERRAQGIPPLPLDAEQTAALIELLKDPKLDAQDNRAQRLLHLLEQRVPAGVDDAAYIKAGFLTALAEGKEPCTLIDAAHATRLLGTMLGGYNVESLVRLLASEDSAVAAEAVRALTHTLLIFDAFNDITDLAKGKNAAADNARAVLQSWADGEWFSDRPALAPSTKAIAFKVPGEINTDDLSPAPDAWSRPDIPLHALAMLKMPREGVEAPLETIAKLKQSGHPVAFVGDVVGTGSSRKSAVNSLLWYIGDDIPFIPNKRTGGICLGGQIAPIFFNTLEDAGSLPIECDVKDIATGDLLDIRFNSDTGTGSIHRDGGESLCEYALGNAQIADAVRAGGRIPLIIGRGLSDRACSELGRPPCPVFRRPDSDDESSDAGYTLAQKIVGRACGVEGVRAGTYCEPRISTVGSQDTTGPMTRDELKELACLGFSADLVMQSFCHTVAYPKPVDIDTQHQLPDFFRTRGGVALRPGDGIIHSWLNRMLLPDQVGTGGDSHTRFPLGISFPAGSGLVAFAAAMGVMPLTMPESVRVRFHGTLQPGITLRDLVNAIPYAAIQDGSLTVAKEGKQNIFSGRCLEVEGLPDLKLEQAFEFADASAERSCSGCTVRLNPEPVVEYLRSNVVLLRWMVGEGYGDQRTLERRADAMEEWLAKPELLEPDGNAEYAHSLDIDLDSLTEPLLACPNDPDDVRPLSEVAGRSIDEVFIGSCMTNIGHFRAAGELLRKSLAENKKAASRLWICPPTRMDQHQLTEEGYYSVFGATGARTEVPGCSLCMGNQARIEANSTAVSTSTRNFPNRLGDGADVFLASAELSAVAAVLGKLPTPEQYLQAMETVNPMAAEVYRYLNFDQISSYRQSAGQDSSLASEIVTQA